MDLAHDNRYARHLSLAGVGAEGQAKLAAARLLIVGLGGLGSAATQYLAGAGIGRLVLADFDTVELSNLHRQPLHGTTRVGQLKTESAVTACRELNPDVTVETIDHALYADELDGLLGAIDVVLDCSDNLATRQALNAACVATATPLVSGAAIRMEGQLLVIRPELAGTPCYRCLVPTVPADDAPAGSCAMEGVMGPVVGIIGAAQALEAIKLILDLGAADGHHLWVFDGLHFEWMQMRLVRSPACELCVAR